MPHPGQALFELASFPEVRIGHTGSLLVMVWRGRVTMESVYRAAGVVKPFAARRPDFSLLAIVLDQASGPTDSELITVGVAASTDVAMNIHRMAVVVPADEKAKRVFMQGLLVLIADPLRARVFGTASMALDWLEVDAPVEDICAFAA